MIDIEDAVLRRLALAPPPSAYAISLGNRHDVIALDGIVMEEHDRTTAYLRELRVRLLCLARRLRRELSL